MALRRRALAGAVRCTASCPAGRLSSAAAEHLPVPPEYLHPPAALSLGRDPDHPLATYRRRLVIERRRSSGDGSGPAAEGIQQGEQRSDEGREHAWNEQLLQVEEQMARLRQRQQELLGRLAGSKWELDIRPLNPDDRERQHEFLARMGQEDHWKRFFSQKHRYSFREIQRLVSVNYQTDFALAAICRATDRLLGVAQYFGVGADSAEMAIMVDGAMKGTGLSSVLLDQLCCACRELGTREVVATFLAENQPAIKLFDHVLGRYATKVSSVEEDGFVEATWRLNMATE